MSKCGNSEPIKRLCMAIQEVVREDLQCEITKCYNHTYSTMKVIANPEKAYTVEVKFPSVICEGAHNDPECEDWSIERWKNAVRMLPIEFAVQGYSHSRMMARAKPEANPLEYAKYFWIKFDVMKGWNIKVGAEETLPKLLEAGHEASVEEAEKETGAIEVPEIQEEVVEENQPTAPKQNLQDVYGMMGMRFAAM